MSKAVRIISLSLLIVFILACNQPSGPTPTGVSVILTEAALTVQAPTLQATGGQSVQEEFNKIDEILGNTLRASIVYNVPSTMNLDETSTIEMLLNPTTSPQILATQITESGTVVTGSIEITPRMKAELLAQDDGLSVQPMEDNPEQIVSGTDTTKWTWFVTAKKGGSHQLTLVVYRLVKYEGQDFWREVESYKADINVDVTMVQQVKSLDWKWVAGILITALLIPAFWRFIDGRKKKRKGH